MRVGTNIPEVGTVIDWDIAEIMERDSLDLDFYKGDWELMLTHKRGDSHYEDVKESIKRWGFVRPLTSYVDNNELQFGDGHHRLAAAIELGMTSVPVEVCRYSKVANDSGEWYLEPGTNIDSIKNVSVY